ncbi:MAG TPA: hypothetical protein VMV27_15015 [Candidatus Binataceae bacterium]|nr:hypothetical protein [Candidatus Binataceae bacterium]
MSFPRQVTRVDQKLGAILLQMARLRRRLNALAIQRVAFRTLAILVLAGALIFAAANWLAPLAFLGVGAALAIAALAAVVATARAGWAMRASAVRAAEIADDRADLKGRLATIVEVAPSGERGELWPYVIEDALAHREEFLPALIERHRIERSVWMPCAALLAAALLVPLARANHPALLAQSDEAPEVTVDLDDLQLRPADPGDNAGVEMQADSATMSRLDAKLAREGARAGAGESSAGILSRARTLASRVQSKLRGEAGAHKRRLTLKLADADGAQASNPRGDDAAARSHHRKHYTAGQFKSEHLGGEEDVPLPPIDKSAHAQHTAQPRGDRPSGPEAPGSGGSENSPDTDSTHEASDQRGDQISNGGASHGIGADPDSLFGAPSNPTMGTEGFEISIEARPMEHGAKGSGQGYLPPKVRTPLSPAQRPDEPIARAAVPAEDRTIIERVFER